MSAPWTDWPDLPVPQLLNEILLNIGRALPATMGVALVIAHHELAVGQATDGLWVLTTTGVGAVLAPLIGRVNSPTTDAAAGHTPVVTADVWNDPRWPELTPTQLSTIHAVDREEIARVRGTAAIPGAWNDNGTLVLTVYLTEPADKHTLEVLAQHEQLASCAVTIASATAGGPNHFHDVLEMLHTRSTIEQAKGAIMTLKRCEATEAWRVLQRASQEFNVKLRELTVALVEHIGHAPAEQASAPHRAITPSPHARRAATLVWQALTTTHGRAADSTGS